MSQQYSRLVRAYDQSSFAPPEPEDRDVRFRLDVEWYLFDSSGAQTKSGVSYGLAADGRSGDDLRDGDSLSLLAIADAAHHDAFGTSLPSDASLDTSYGPVSLTVREYGDDNGGSGAFNVVLPDGNEFYGDVTFTYDGRF